MKRVLHIVLICICVLFATVNNTKALTATAYVHWYGGWCTLCSCAASTDLADDNGAYACAWNPWYNYYVGDTNAFTNQSNPCDLAGGRGGWFSGVKKFLDPLPSGATITGIQVEVCEADCGSTNFGVAINGWSLGTYYTSGNCYCGGTYTFSMSTTNVSGLIAAYHFDGGSTITNHTTWDTLTLTPNSTACITGATIIFTYVLGANLNTLPAQSLANIPYCPCDSIDIPYYAAGSFNSGNVFTAQLSNSTGNFSSPVILGTLTSQVSGTIHGFIPCNTPLGTQYSIRVVGSNPSTVGNDTVENITISNAAPTITSSVNTVCSGHSLSLVATSGQSYIWYDSVPSQAHYNSFSTTGPSIIVTPTATTTYYKVYVANTSGCQGTSPIDTVTLAPLPNSPTFILGPGSMCNYSSAVYTTNNISNATSYVWDVWPSYRNGYHYSNPQSNPGGYQGDTVIPGATNTATVEFGNASSFNYLTVWAEDSCGLSVDSAKIEISLITGEPIGFWVGGVSNSWFTNANWCGGVPTATTDVQIDGTFGQTCASPYYEYMPVINQDSSATAAVCRGLLMFGDTDTLSIVYGSSICFCYAGLTIYGDVWMGGYGYNPGNEATFNPSQGTVTFAGPGNSPSYDYTNNISPIAGNGVPYAGGGNAIFGFSNISFYNLTVNKGSDNTTVLENIGGGSPGSECIVSMLPGGNLSLNNGTFLLSQDSSTVRASSLSNPFIIPSTAALDLNGGWMLKSADSIVNYGQFIMDINSANDTIGTSSNEGITNSGSSAEMNIIQGNLYVAGELVTKSGASVDIDNTTSIDQTPITVTLNTSGTTNNVTAVLDVDGSSKFDFSNGTIVLERPSSGTLASPYGNDLKIKTGSGAKTLAGTFQFGDGNTPTSSIFDVLDSGAYNPFNIVNINAYNTPTVKLEAPTTTEYLNLTSGILNLNHQVLTISSTANTGITYNTTSPIGYILAEDTNNYAAVNWTTTNVGSVTYTFPFGNSSGVSIPVKVTNDGAAPIVHNFQIATYAPIHNGHMPYPPTVNQIRDSNSNHINDSANMVNRFWEIDANSVTSTNPVDVEFHYAYSEKPANGDTSAAQPLNAMKAQRWVSANGGWVQPYLVSNNGYTGTQSTASLVNNAITGGMVKVKKMNHCSPWALTKGGLNPQPLPIELLNFNAVYDGKNVNLNWSTASETNNDYFTISKTRDQSEYDFVARVSGHGNSNVQWDYSAIDYAPYTGLSYYQLTQTDYNGNSTQAGIVPVTIGDNSFSIINIYNDNTKDIMNVYINDNTAENITAVLYDVMGRVVISQAITTVKGVNLIEFNSDNLPKGIYLISISNNSQRLTGKIAN